VSSINQIGGSPAPYGVDNIQAADKKNTENAVQDLPAKSTQELASSLLKELPQLAAPLMASGLSLEVLVEAIGGEERKTSIKAGGESLKAKADARKTTNEKALAEIKEQIETLAKKESLSPFLKAFKIIGLILGAVAAVATTALGAMTGNPLMVAAGVIMSVMVIDSIVSEASDGKYSIAAGVTALAKEAGASEETAMWIGLGATMLLTITAVVLSLGASAASSGTTIATTAMNVLAKAQQATAVANGVLAVASGASQIASSCLDYEIANSKARTKELEAILERIRESIETEEDYLKFIVEKFTNLTSKVTDIITEANAAQTQILSGEPAMA
jgi:hypothetical protein